MAILPTTTGSKVLINGQPPQVPVTVSSAHSFRSRLTDSTIAINSELPLWYDGPGQIMCECFLERELIVRRVWTTRFEA